jgi:hypothetical protein
MAFLTYKKSVVDGKASYEKIKPLKLGGRTGLLAQHVKTLSEEDSRSWKLDPAELLKLAGQEAGDTAVLFDVAGVDSTSICLYELVQIHGSCRDTSTQLALDMTVVVDREIGNDAPAFAKKFEIILAEKPRMLGETLALSGGPGGGDWKWGTPPMQLGATIVQAQHHGGGEPCPNCNCGRRETMNK